MSKAPRGFIAIHCGAGYHSKKKSENYNNLAKRACQAAIEALRSGRTAREAVVLAITCLEDDTITNAGNGSNLTFAGDVECDASMMCGKTLNFGAIGAVSQVKNPIKLAHELLKYQEEVESNLMGRIPPNMLCGKGARKFAKERNLEVVGSQELISEDMFRQHCKYTKAYTKELKKYQENSNPPAKKQRVDSPTIFKPNDSNQDQSVLHDTVGAVCIDCYGDVVAGVSSGGILIKQPGRVGQAAVYGAGCWADKKNEDCIAISTTGSGESLTKTLLAYTLALKLQNSNSIVTDLDEVFNDCFMDSRFVNDITGRFAGVLGVKSSPLHTATSIDNEFEIFVTFSSDSMSIGYQTTADETATAEILRKDKNQTTAAFHKIL